MITIKSNFSSTERSSCYLHFLKYIYSELIVLIFFVYYFFQASRELPNVQRDIVNTFGRDSSKKKEAKKDPPMKKPTGIFTTNYNSAF